MRSRSLLRVSFLMAMVMMAAPAANAAAPPPLLPCGEGPLPPYPPLGGVTVQAWGAADLPRDWRPPSCTGWSGAGGRMLVALSASFAYTGESDDLLARFGAISSMRGIRYWSTTDKSWRPLILDAAALAGPDIKSHRGDFSAREMKAGRPLLFMERDSRSAGPVIYRMRLLESGPDRFVLTVENATPVKFMLFTLFSPGEMQSVYFVERLAPGRWGYYSLLRAAATASGLVSGHAGSYMNRGQALYRHFLGEATDQEPPAAR